MKLKLLVATALVAAMAMATPAMAGDDKAQDQGAAVKEKKICHTETVTGSLISKRRICMTKAEWDQLAQQSKNSVDKFTSKSTGVPGSASNPMAAQ